MIRPTLGLESSSWEIVKSMIEETFAAKDLDEACSFIESIAAVNNWMPRRQDELLGLRMYCETLNKDDQLQLLNLIKYIATLALKSEKLFTKKGIRILKSLVSLLRKNAAGLLYYSSEQIGWVLAHAFFWWIPVANSIQDMPSSINFVNWFSGKHQVYQDKIEKLMCYFKEYEREDLLVQAGKAKHRKVSFEKLTLAKDKYKKMDDKFFGNWAKKLSKATVKSLGFVEDEDDALITDFANKYMGGGVMNRGYVQEEILFLDYPELIMSTFMCAKMQDFEAICITGVRKIGPYDDFNDLDKLSRIERTFIAIDALHHGSFQSQISQFESGPSLRELKKAIIGFRGDSKEEEVKSSHKKVSTGRWGCGAFNGNAELKFLLQWIAASINNREMVFYSFDHKDWSKLEQIALIYTDQSVSDIYNDLIQFRKHLHKLKNVDKVYISKNKMQYLLSDYLFEKYRI